MEKNYEAVLDMIKHAFLSACWNYAYVNAQDYNGDTYYECENVSRAEGEVASLRALVDQLGIKVTEEEIDKETASAKQYFLEEDVSEE